ncbi:O-methyltransferase [Frankia gtarii]|uniref:O-methyltransferase n=1 Tax=Frankia gtarii TaxID=2950102 RepID=UPI0021C1CEA6|nr:class I SAM-dependent methyltransferase [Frankia gtarii]
MDSLTTSPVVDVLDRLLAEARAADQPLHQGFADGSYSVRQMLEDDARDFRWLCRDQIDYFLNIDPQFGRFLHMAARARRANQIVEFGTSFGVSTIYLASAVRDNGRGRVITTELEPTKAERARTNLSSAGLADLVDIRVGDALQTLRNNLDGQVDMVLLDGAYCHYLAVLRLLEPHLAPGSLIVADNALDLSGEYLAHVGDPANGYLTVPLPFHPDRGNTLSLYTGT